MARMYSRKRGKSGSNKPIKKEIPSWIRYKPKEVELLIVKIAKEIKEASKIGIILRDTYGIPSVKLITKKTITQILREKNLTQEIPEDLMAVIKTNIKIKKHLEENKQDKVAKRGLQIAESKIKRLVNYYKKSKKLPKDWKYNPEKIRLLIE
ncbi:MAG: 30S ribosomal protein S15 [Candidatus Woesearchaeota archaeon]